FLQENKIVSLEQLKAILGVDVRMTVFRVLRRLEYLSSYSHRGRFYTLRQIPDFDEFGLWSFRAVRFSKFGNLLATAKTLVETAEAGHTAVELENVLHVEVKHTLLHLTRRGGISRRKIGRSHVYLSVEKGRQRQQELTREDRQAQAEVGMGLAVEVLPDEVKAAIILLFSMLDEKQRRLYAGLEAAKLGHGGDRMIAELLGLDAHTVAKGRRELFEDSVDRSRIRKEGGGRKTVEKNAGCNRRG
ncbi:MAG: hypothetical protein V1800_18635, partial [Candidatus Latescibacterota bacterium]